MINETKYKAWGEVRYSSGAEQTKYTYTGQYSYTSDFGLMFYNARWYDSSLGRFTQADSVIPAGVQGLDRFAYTNNNPIRYTDPSGHKPSCLDDTLVNGRCLDAVGYLKYELQQTYKIKLQGTWKVGELTNLSEALEKTATYVGGVDKLNAYFLKATRKHNANATGIFIERVAAQRPYGKSVAAWCGDNTQNGCAENTIMFGDDLFTMQYQDGKSLGAGRGGAAYPRSSMWSYDQKFQFSMAHEFGHIITDANPSSFTQYLLDNSDPSKTDGSKYEAMANEIALQVISSGNSFSDFGNPKVWGY